VHLHFVCTTAPPPGSTITTKHAPVDFACSVHSSPCAPWGRGARGEHDSPIPFHGLRVRRLPHAVRLAGSGAIGLEVRPIFPCAIPSRDLKWTRGERQMRSSMLPCCALRLGQAGFAGTSGLQAGRDGLHRRRRGTWSGRLGEVSAGISMHLLHPPQLRHRVSLAQQCSAWPRQFSRRPSAEFSWAGRLSPGCPGVHGARRLLRPCASLGRRGG